MRKGGRIVALAALVACGAVGPTAWAGTSYNSTTDSSWFNGANWANDPATAADDDIYLGQGFTSLTPDGVVFDPATDPFYQSNQSFTWGTTTDTAQNFATINSGQIYLAGGSGSTTTSALGKLTVKSGTLTVKGTTGLIIGRLQSSNTDPSEQAALVVSGGTVTLTAGSIDMSSSNSSATAMSPSQNNTLDYTNTGTINATGKNGSGLRMDPVSIASGSTFNSTLIVRHAAGGTGSINFASVVFGQNTTSAGVSNNTAEFHYAGAGVSTVNVGNGSAGNSLKINNIAPATGIGGVNSFLSLVLDEAPTLTPDGRAPDLGLFKLDDSGGATPNTQAVNTTDPTKEFKTLDGIALTEGAELDASFGGQTYKWNIYYDGNIAADGSITGATTGNDVVLVGQPASAVPEPASVGLIAMGGLIGLGRRKRRA
jgi:hypothetical protein